MYLYFSLTLSFKNTEWVRLTKVTKKKTLHWTNRNRSEVFFIFNGPISTQINNYVTKRVFFIAQFSILLLSIQCWCLACFNDCHFMVWVKKKTVPNRNWTLDGALYYLILIGQKEQITQNTFLHKKMRNTKIKLNGTECNFSRLSLKVILLFIYSFILPTAHWNMK